MSERSASILELGDRLNGFEIVRIQPGMSGPIYFCRIDVPEGSSRCLEPHVVFKSFPEVRRWDEAARERFESAAAQWIALPWHPNIVRVLSLISTGPGFMLSTAYEAGGNLRQLLDRERVDLARALALASQICTGVSFLHSRGIVHGDIKPENVLLSHAQVPKLADFGTWWAARGPRTGSSPQACHNMGTVAYAAPELFDGASEPTAQSDQFSLAVVVYELIAGLRPFLGSSSEVVRERILQHDPPGLRSGHDVLERVVLRALAKDPKKRFRDVDEFRMALVGAAAQIGLANAVPAAGVPAEEDAGLHWRRGFGLARLGRFEESLAAYRKTLECEPDWLNHINVAVALRRCDRAAEALGHDEQAVRLIALTDPDNANGWRAHQSHAVSLARLGREEEAISVLRQACERYPDAWLLYRELAFFDSDCRAWAIEQLLEKHASNPTLDSVYSICLEGVEFARRGLPDVGIRFLELAVVRHPNSGMAWYNLGVAKHQQDGLGIEPYQCYSRALCCGYRNPLALFHIAAFHAAEGDSTAAETYMKIAGTMASSLVPEVAHIPIAALPTLASSRLLTHFDI